ncbi:MAG: 50S ribosomal protein L4 [Candidatus Omnitrophica bacterium]|nr:50S ribosomal protein L4 [Candidatus Omnitrophota bacterium]
MEAITLPIYNTEGKEVDKIKLNTSVFDGNVNKDAIYQVIVATRANMRQGTAATKTRGEVSGGGKKPWRQKGTGRARVGSIRSPLWRHGGVIFGPHPRDYSYKLPAKIRNLALKSCLNSKVKEGNFIILDEVKVEKPKTNEFFKIFGNLRLLPKNRKPGSILMLIDKFDDNLKMASRNINFLNVNIAGNTHAYEVLSNNKLLVTKDGLSQLVKRLSQ